MCYFLNIDAGCSKRGRLFRFGKGSAKGFCILKSLHRARADEEPVPEVEFDIPWGCKSVLRKWNQLRSVGGRGAGAGRVR